MGRYAIARSSLWRPLLLLLGATDERSWLDIGPAEVVAEFGWKQITVRRANIAGAERSSWPWWSGIGWRTDLRHAVGLIGAVRPIVRIRLHTAQRISLLGIPIRMTELYLSVDDPDAIVRELTTAHPGIAPPRN